MSYYSKATEMAVNNIFAQVCPRSLHHYWYYVDSCMYKENKVYSYILFIS